MYIHILTYMHGKSNMRVIHICIVNKTGNVRPPILPVLQRLHGNECTWVHDIRLVTVQHVFNCMNYYEAIG